MDGHRDLASLLHDRFAAEGGCLSFERFMELALYDEDFGYYSHHIETVGGSRADFGTWATRSDLSRPLSHWIRAEIDHWAWKGRTVSLIEVGGGDGTLARGLLRRLHRWPWRRIRYHLVEISGPLRKRQGQRLRGLPVNWHETVEEALDAADGRAILFFNELVDAFPARWLRWNGTAWEEIFVRLEPERGLGEEFRPIPSGPAWLARPRTGQRVEIHDSYRRWFTGWSPRLAQGSLLTLDYGDIDEAIYARRPGGTMRGYFRHQRVEGAGVYARIGRQDLTCDVNFGDLVRWAESSGWTTVSLRNQAELPDHTATSPAEIEASWAFRALHLRKIPDSTG